MQTPVKMILVGDSAAQFMLGFDSTLPAEMDFMVTMMARYPNVRDKYSNYEKNPTTLDCFKLTMDRYPLMKDFVEFKVGDSKDINLEDNKFDFVLIDGDHSYEGVKSDFLKIRPYVRSGGVICFHDDSDH